MRGCEINWCKPQAAVAIDLGEDSAHRHYDERTDIRIDPIADQHLADAADHRLHQHARDAGAMHCYIRSNTVTARHQGGAIRDVEHDTAGIALVREVGGEGLDDDRIAEGQGGSCGEISIERE